MKKGRNIYRPDLGIRDIFKFFKKKTENYTIELPLFKAIWKDYVDNYVIEEALKGNLGYVPNNGGFIVRSKKMKIKTDGKGNIVTKNLKVDYHSTRKLWEEDPKAKEEHSLVYFLNLHSDRIKYSWLWAYKEGPRFKGYSSYNLKLMRQQCRKLPARIFEKGGTL